MEELPFEQNLDLLRVKHTLRIFTEQSNQLFASLENLRISRRNNFAVVSVKLIKIAGFTHTISISRDE